MLSNNESNTVSHSPQNQSGQQQVTALTEEQKKEKRARALASIQARMAMIVSERKPRKVVQ
eukprot:494598-Rhodomonas_salina.1